MAAAFPRGQCSSDASIGVGYSHSASARHASDDAEELNEEVNCCQLHLSGKANMPCN